MTTRVLIALTLFATLAAHAADTRDERTAACLSYATDKLADATWTGASRVRSDVRRMLDGCDLQRASGPLVETDGVHWRHYPNGMVAVNATDERASIRVDVPEGLLALADAASDDVLPVRRGKVRLTLGPGEGGVYVTPLALAGGHLREAILAAETVLAQASPDDTTLADALDSARSAHSTMSDATEPADARESVATALRAVAACLDGDDLPARAAGELTRAQLYLSRAWSITAVGEGMPQPSVLSDEVSGMPQLVRLCGACSVLHGVDLVLNGVVLLDADATTTVPAEIESSEGMSIFTTAPSLRADLLYRVVGKVTNAPEDLPMAIAKDYRPQPSVSLKPADAAGAWDGSRGLSVWTVTNNLDQPVACLVAVEAPEGYRAVSPGDVTVPPGESVEVTVQVSSDAPAAPPAGVTLTLTLPALPAAGEAAHVIVFE